MATPAERRGDFFFSILAVKMFLPVKYFYAAEDRRRPNASFFHHSFCKFKRERSENVFLGGESDFYCRTVAMLSVCHCSLCPELCSYYVPSGRVTNGRVTNGRVPHFPIRGANNFSNTFRIVFRILFRVFQPFSYRLKHFSGSVSFCRFVLLPKGQCRDRCT